MGQLKQLPHKRKKSVYTWSSLTSRVAADTSLVVRFRISDIATPLINSDKLGDYLAVILEKWKLTLCLPSISVRRSRNYIFFKVIRRATYTLHTYASHRRLRMYAIAEKLKSRWYSHSHSWPFGRARYSSVKSMMVNHRRVRVYIDRWLYWQRKAWELSGHPIVFLTLLAAGFNVIHPKRCIRTYVECNIQADENDSQQRGDIHYIVHVTCCIFSILALKFGTQSFLFLSVVNDLENACDAAFLNPALERRDVHVLRMTNYDEPIEGTKTIRFSVLFRALCARVGSIFRLSRFDILELERSCA